MSSRLRTWASLVAGRSVPGDPAARRTVGITRGALGALAAQGVTILTGFATVPLSVRYLGSELYGAWATLGSILGWLTIGDLGIGNHLTNVLSAARGLDDARGSRRLVSTAFFSLAAVALGFALVGALAWPRVDWMRVFNVHTATAGSQLAPAAGIAFLGFCAGLPLVVADRVYTSYQEGATANAWVAATSAASLATLYLATTTGGGLVAVVAAFTTAGLGVRAASAGWLFSHRHPELRPRWADVAPREATHFFRHGAEFFLVQIAALVLFSTDNVIIAQVLGAEAVTPYAVAWRLFTVPNLVIAAAFPYLWAGYAEALARGDTAWVVRTLKVTVIAGTTIAIVLSAPLVIFGRGIIRVWAGPAAVPPWTVLVWMAAWNVLQGPANAVVCLLNAMGRIRWQISVGLACAVANVGCSIWWGRAFGLSGVIAATVVSYLALAVAPQLVVLSRALRSLRAQPAPGVRPPSREASR